MENRQNDSSQSDKPEDWLNGALIFARALGLMLNENEGLVVNLTGDLTYYGDESVTKVIVFRKDQMVRIVDCADEKLKEGDFVIISDVNPN
jgi:hypothetical protein